MLGNELYAAGESLVQKLYNSGIIDEINLYWYRDTAELEITVSSCQLSAERLQLAINSWGNNLTEQSIINTWQLKWVVNHIDPAQGKFTITIHNIYEATWSDSEQNTLSHLVTIGLLDQPSKKAYPVSKIESLHMLYASIEELEEYYISWINQVSMHKIEEKAFLCNSKLHKYRLCCLNHRLLMVQRITFMKWFNYFYLNLSEHSNSGKVLLDNPPSKEAIIREIRYYLKTDYNPETMLNDKFSLDNYIKTQKWMLPTNACNRSRFNDFKCCETHVSLSALRIIFELWMVYYNEEHQIWKYKNRNGESPETGTQAWVEFLIHLLKLNRNRIPIPEYYEKNYMSIVREYAIE